MKNLFCFIFVIEYGYEDKYPFPEWIKINYPLIMAAGELFFIIFCSIAAINAVFIAVYSWFQREKNLIPNVLFTIMLILAAYRISNLLLHDLVDDFQLGVKIPAFFNIPTGALVGPLLYFYIRSVTWKEFKFRWTDILHIIPFLLLYLSILNVYKSIQIIPAPLSLREFKCIHLSIILLQLLIYLFYSFKYSNNLINISKGGFSAKETLNPYWIRNIVIAVSFLWIILTMYVLEILMQTYLYVIYLEPIYYSILIFMIISLELRYKRITTINNFISRLKASVLPLQEILKYKSSIIDFMKNKEVYKDRDITLGGLARELSMTPHLLSQIINEQFSCNFNDFINSYRVEDAKKLLAKPDMKNFTIASIAYDCGFNTLSAFNAAFKKFTGFTPSQFRSKDK